MRWRRGGQQLLMEAAAVGPGGRTVAAAERFCSTGEHQTIHIGVYSLSRAA
jgi:hypothetical protein